MSSPYAPGSCEPRKPLLGNGVCSHCGARTDDEKPPAPPLGAIQRSLPRAALAPLVLLLGLALFSLLLLVLWGQNSPASLPQMIALVTGSGAGAVGIAAEKNIRREEPAAAHASGAEDAAASSALEEPLSIKDAAEPPPGASAAADLADPSASVAAELAVLSASAAAELAPPPLEKVLARVGGKDKTLIFATASEDYLDFLENWYISVERVGYGHKVLFVSEDETAHRVLTSKWPQQTVLGKQLYPKLVEADTSAKQDKRGWSTQYYNGLVDRRPQYFKSLLKRRYNVLYCDVDMVWLQDPFPFFKGRYDLWIEEDARAFEGAFERFPRDRPGERMSGPDHELCTCFMMVRPTRGSMTLIDAWIEALATKLEKSGKFVTNQPVFNKALTDLGRGKVRLGVLPVGSFPSGCLFFGRNETRQTWCRKGSDDFWAAVEGNQTSAVVIHNNWKAGYDLKLKRFKQNGLWNL